MTVRLANLSDASDIYCIHTSAIREICSKYYKEEEIKQWIARQSQQRYLGYIDKKEIMIVEDEGRNVLGFGHLTQNEEEDLKTTSGLDEKEDVWRVGVIRALYVRPDCTRNGIGQTLLKCMEQKSREKQAKELAVFSTLNAISFYERFGFQVVAGETKQCGQGVNLQCTKLLKRL